MTANRTLAGRDNCPSGVMNFTTEEAVEEVLYSGFEDLLYTFFLPVIEVIGIVANLLFIGMVFRVQRMRTITNMYLVNIAIADLLFIGYGCTFAVIVYFTSPVRNDMPFSHWLGCVIVWWPSMITYFASILLITLATVEKYYAICHPIQHRLVTGKSRTFRIIAISWLLGTALSGLLALRYAKVQTYCLSYPYVEEKYAQFPTHIDLCTPINDLFLVFSETVMFVPFFLALIGNVYMYGRIIYALSHRNVTYNTEDAMQLRQRQIRNQVARMLIINGSLFFCCQFPWRLLSINLFVQESRGQGYLSLEQYGSLAVISRALLLVNSLANPFVYFTTSANYREGFREAYFRTNGRN